MKLRQAAVEQSIAALFEFGYEANLSLFSEAYRNKKIKFEMIIALAYPEIYCHPVMIINVRIVYANPEANSIFTQTYPALYAYTFFYS